MSICLSLGNPSGVFAADTNGMDKVFCEENGILYSGCGSQCSSSGAANAAASPVGAASTGASAPGLTPEQVAFIDRYHDIAQQLSVQYGIPWEAVMAQGLEESGAGTSNFAIERNNFFGIGAFDSNPNAAKSYATPEAGWQGYYDNIVNTPTYRQHGVFQGNTVTDPQAYLEAIKAAGYATDPNYVSKNMALVNAIDGYAQSKGWATSAQLAQQHPEMLANATNNSQGANAGNNTPGANGAPGSSGQGGCGGSSAAPTGNVAQVAQQMGTWGQQYGACYNWGGGHGNTQDLQNDIANHFVGSAGVDCSGFVRAVLYQATGKDPGAMDTNAMCASPEFQHIPRAQAQPGDIAIDCSSHVEVITGVNNGTFTTVGSHSTGCGDGLGASPGNFQGSGDYVLRYTG